MPKPTRQDKKDLYALLRQLVILRDEEKCLKCSRRDRLHLSHIYPKGRHRRMEFDPNNLKFLCLSCHLFWWHKHPVEAMQWLSVTIDPVRLAKLKMRAMTVDKSPIDYKLEKIYLQQEINRLTHLNQ